MKIDCVSTYKQWPIQKGNQENNPTGHGYKNNKILK
jgi:hypothetical protein